MKQKGLIKNKAKSADTNAQLHNFQDGAIITH